MPDSSNCLLLANTRYDTNKYKINNIKSIHFNLFIKFLDKTSKTKFRQTLQKIQNTIKEDM
jgi:hypothetical protein